MFQRFRILPEDVALGIFRQLNNAEWEAGKARTEKASETIKRNAEIIPRNESDRFWPEVMQIRDAFMQHGGFMGHTLTYKMTIPKFNRYTGGGTYRRHYDASPMTTPEMRTDFACTLFLTPPDEYEGGELCLEDGYGGVVQAPKGEPGTCVVYNCGEGHWVNPVTRGARISSILWLRSLVKDPTERRILSKFREILHRCESEDKPIEAYGEDYTTLTGIQTTLARKWIDA